jgi:UDP-N-acetylmuramoyl-L-alanyl-D-glutamate--2,6-diaminopimelate ligase
LRLDDLAREAGLTGAQVLGDPSVKVTSVTMDSRRVEPGALFACVPGARSDGHAFAAEAVAAGAVALLCERPVALDVSQILVPSARAALGPVSHSIYGRPSERLHVVGVTGTNGKTTTVAFLAAIFEANGWPAAAVGTLTQARTTPEAPELHELMAGWLAGGGRAVAMEVSSHALVQHRTDAVRFEAGVFTNLSPEHLDYHGDMESYFEAKARLFEPGRVGVAVVGTDDEWGRRLAERVERAGGRLVRFSAADARAVSLHPEGSEFTWRGLRVRIPLGGRFNLINAVAAASAASAIGVADEQIAQGLSALPPVPGRFERVDAGQDFLVVVDYAHTPDGLAKVLDAAREVCSGRLIVVFGAAGDRDRTKRPLMAAEAACRADLALVTSDNPRSEDPEAIIAEVMAGATGSDHVRAVTDRSAAIALAVSAARSGDVVLIAGKGHEKGQEVAGRILPFDDVEVAAEAIRRRLSSRPVRP